MRFTSLFSANQTVERLSLEELVEWHLHVGEGKLRLSTIQRSLVWSNAQIINYWDSLLRGYPPGMIMVNRPNGPGAYGRDETGKTRPASRNDWLLFDGQQRLASILLGRGGGKWKESRRLWIDFGKDPGRASGLKFQLRMSSTGQPFGYRLDEPNQKLELRKRQTKWEEWKRAHPNVSEAAAFENAQGQDLIEADCAIPLSELCTAVRQSNELSHLPKLNGVEASRLDEFTKALRRLFKSEMVVRLVDDEIVEQPEEYVRFFRRLGQGGTPLSNDEFTYSMIKYKYPSIHDRMQKIMEGKAGRLAGEVDLVLSALRVAKTLAEREPAEEWRILSRPTPEFVSELDTATWRQAKERFLSLIPPSSAEAQPGELELALVAVRHALTYSGENPGGFPPMLLARFPKELVDVLVLFAVKNSGRRYWTESDCTALRAFTLHWLLFVAYNEKAAWQAFKHGLKADWHFSPSAAQRLTTEFEKEGIARFMPRRSALEKIRNGLRQPASNNGRLRTWAERFTEADKVDAHQPGEALRVLSTNNELIKCALMWLQREYLDKRFPDYDPTSGRDEDLPVDLDHVIPHTLFGDDWRPQQKRLDESVDKDNFGDQRNTVGNSLGNYRWLCASENRRRGAGGLDAGEEAEVGSLQLDDRFDLVSNPADWNKIIPKPKEHQYWSTNDVAKFQSLIDMRTLELYERLLEFIEAALPGDTMVHAAA
jgi:hypothetical protein